MKTQVSDELKAICKELNGMTLDWLVDDMVKFPAIILANPEISETISIKPYGITRTSIRRKLIDADEAWGVKFKYPDFKRYFKSEVFCFSTLRIVSENKSKLVKLLKMAKAGKGKPQRGLNGNPVCSY